MFWLLGATDGHARNFSVFPGPGTRFNLILLYDVMSPSLATLHRYAEATGTRLTVGLMPAPEAEGRMAEIKT